MEESTMIKVADFKDLNRNLIKVIGVGGAGSSAVAYMERMGIKDISFAVCNTDLQALEMDSPMECVTIGTNITHGRGAGNKPSQGRLAAEDNIEDIERLIQDTTGMVFIAAGMGGGTGTGAAPVVAKLCKEKGLLTVGIVTLPFKNEGKKRLKQAIEGVKELEKCVDSIVVINNERIRDIYGNLGLSEAFAKADDLLCLAARSISYIVMKEGNVNVDFNDVCTIMRNGGVTNMGVAEAEGPDRIILAMEEAVNSPLLNNNDILGAQEVLLYVETGDGDNRLLYKEIGMMLQFVQDKTGGCKNVIWGDVIDESLGEKVRITVIVTNLEKDSAVSEQPEVSKVSLEDDFDLENQQSNDDFIYDEKPKQKTIEFSRASRNDEAYFDTRSQARVISADVDYSELSDEELDQLENTPRKK